MIQPKIIFRLVFLFVILLLPLQVSAIEIQVQVQVQQNLGAPAHHGIQKLLEALSSRNMITTLTELGANTDDKYVICVGLSDNEYIAKAIREGNLEKPITPEALAVRIIYGEAQTRIIIAGADATGIMYAALDIAERIRQTPSSQDIFSNLQNISEAPFVADRSVSTYTMNRSWFEQNLFNQNYWSTYFDMLASNRINSYVFIFGYECAGFMAPPYPYFFDVEGFPQVQFNGLSKKQQTKNRETMQRVIDMAHERGIRITFGIWDHIYRGAVQAGRIDWAPSIITPETPNVVTGITTENLASYTKAALSELIKVFPGVDALQFRMHEEAGLKSEEIPVFWGDVFTMLKQLKPTLKYDLRAKGLPDVVIQDAVKAKLPFRIATKFWMEQVGLPFHPTHVNPENQTDRRHGYADLLKNPKEYDVHWRVWTGGTLRLLLWGDPEFVRRFVTECVPLYGGNSFEINEMLATKMLSVKHETEPYQIHTPKYRHYDYEIQRYWHYFQLWGRLSYNPNANPEIWESEFNQRFGDKVGPHVMKTLHQSSKVLPRIVGSVSNYMYFPVTRGWATMMRLGDLHEYAKDSGTDTEQFQSFPAAAKQLLKGGETSMVTPYQTQDWLKEKAYFILKEVELISKMEKPKDKNSRRELEATLVDFKILANLANYHAERIPGAIWYNVYKETSDQFALDKAIEAESKAIDAWRNIVKTADGVYGEHLRFGSKEMTVDGALLYEAQKGSPWWETSPRAFPENWTEELGKLEEGLEVIKKLKGMNVLDDATREIFIDKMKSQPRSSISVEVVDAGTAIPGKDLQVKVKVSNPKNIEMIQLRFRHLTQFEDYKAKHMVWNSNEDTYSATIPGDFINTNWDLMYFVEIIDADGRGIRIPDMSKELPYVIISVKKD